MNGWRAFAVKQPIKGYEQEAIMLPTTPAPESLIDDLDLLSQVKVWMFNAGADWNDPVYRMVVERERELERQHAIA